MATVRALECLLTIAETGSLSAAATRLHLSQPALSHQVRVLEQEVGAPVVDRLPRGVRLTAAGEAMLEPARGVVLAAARAVALARAAARGDVGALRVACAESMTAGMLAQALATWRAERPEVAIELTEHLSADECATDVLAGHADVAIGPEPSPVPLTISPLRQEFFQLVVAADHPFARRTSVAVAELSDQPFVHYALDNGLAGWLDAVAGAAGVVLRPVVRVRSTTGAAALAAAGLGVGLVPEGTASARAGVSVPLDPPLSRDIVAVHRPHPHPLAHAFCEVLRR